MHLVLMYISKSGENWVSSVSPPRCAPPASRPVSRFRQMALQGGERTRRWLSCTTGHLAPSRYGARAYGAARCSTLAAPAAGGTAAAGSGLLTTAQREEYDATGCLFPIRGLPDAEAASMLERLAAFEAERGLVASEVIRNKGHLKLLWMYDLVRHPVLLDAVESIIGPDILCWGSSLFIKDAGQEKHVAWHQDLYYWDIGTENVCTLWIAFAPSTADNGALEVRRSNPGCAHTGLNCLW
eukprot:COSAG06_NODE_547_length_14431_cov_5.614746_13_plen_240_part_00